MYNLLQFSMSCCRLSPVIDCYLKSNACTGPIEMCTNGKAQRRHLKVSLSLVHGEMEAGVMSIKVLGIWKSTSRTGDASF